MVSEKEEGGGKEAVIRVVLHQSNCNSSNILKNCGETKLLMIKCQSTLKGVF